MAEEIITQELESEAMAELDKLAYTKKNYLTPKEIAASFLSISDRRI